MKLKEKIELIKQGKNLDIFINDFNPYIRYKIAKQGYKLDILINDEDFRVRKVVLIYCKEHIDNEKCKKILLLNKI